MNGEVKAVKNGCVPRECTPAHLQTVDIVFKTGHGETVEMDAVVQLQEVSAGVGEIGTVVALHGSPGSHEDFKYMIPRLSANGIRVVAIDFPGFGYTPHDSRLHDDVIEKVQFAKEVMFTVDAEEHLIFVGHSRGSEIALRMALRYQEMSTGVVLVNPVGLRAHRGIRPLWFITFLAFLWNLGSVFQFLLRPIFYFVFRTILKFKVKDGDVAGFTVKDASLLHPEGQKEFVRLFDDSPLQLLIAYGGLDHIVERGVSEHFVSEFSDIHCMNFEGTDRGSDEGSSPTKWFKERISSGARRMAVCFEHEGHFLQKAQADFLVDAIVSMCETRRKSIPSSL